MSVNAVTRRRNSDSQDAYFGTGEETRTCPVAMGKKHPFCCWLLLQRIPPQKVSTSWRPGFAFSGAFWQTIQFAIRVPWMDAIPLPSLHLPDAFNECPLPATEMPAESSPNLSRNPPAGGQMAQSMAFARKNTQANNSPAATIHARRNTLDVWTKVTDPHTFSMNNLSTSLSVCRD